MISSLLVALIALLVAAKLGGAAAERLGQPAVLGELLAGVAVGALPLLGVGGLAFVATDRTVESLAGLGVILLLFEVGLATRLADLMKVGLSALLVATIGVVVPMVLGFLVGRWLLPDHHWFSALFLGATLCATSVGITARVLTDLGRVATPEGQIILGAAVIDDVMGLIVLAVMAGLAGGGASASGGAAWASAGLVTGKAVLFIVGALVLGAGPGAAPLPARLPPPRQGGDLHLGAGDLLRAGLGGRGGGAGPHRGGLRGRPGAGGRPLRRAAARGGPARGPAHAALLGAGAALLRPHGRPGEAPGAGRRLGAAGAGAHRRGHRRQAGLRAGGGDPRRRSARGRAGDDPARRGGADLRGDGADAEARRPAAALGGGVRRRGGHGAPDHGASRRRCCGGGWAARPAGAPA